MISNNEMIQWSCQRLISLGYQLKSDLPEEVQQTPWSHVARFETLEGYIYLKHMPAELALEAVIIQILHDRFHSCVPSIISDQPELNCFLMKDAGTSLRKILKWKFSFELLNKAVDQFTLLQIAVADRTDIFLNIGVPDWRLDKLSDLFKQLLLQKKILIRDGFSETE